MDRKSAEAPGWPPPLGVGSVPGIPKVNLEGGDPRWSRVFSIDEPFEWSSVPKGWASSPTRQKAVRALLNLRPDRVAWRECKWNPYGGRAPWLQGTTFLAETDEEAGYRPIDGQPEQSLTDEQLEDVRRYYAVRQHRRDIKLSRAG